MATAVLIWHPDLAAYDLGESHPANPLRLSLAVSLMRAYEMLTPDNVVPPRPATENELLLVHAPGYIEAVREAGDWGAGLRPGLGLGTEDNPAYPGMHDNAALTCGASVVGVEEVVSGRRTRTFSIAGGLHHAHRARAAGFSVYNDPAVAIAVARDKNPDLRVLYIDIDAHHGDGVQEAFYGSRDVMTISIHESGLYIYPGTGFPVETGYGDAVGYAVNIPLPPSATDACYRLAFENVVDPVARAFGPDLVVAQLGVDAHHADPQADLALTLPGYRSVVGDIVGLADELCDGRLAALGGGGYNIVDVVPRAWAWVMGKFLGLTPSETIPEAWREHVRSLLGVDAPTSLGIDDEVDLPAAEAAAALELTYSTLADVRAAVFPHHGLTP